jgi:hypothetical protein
LAEPARAMALETDLNAQQTSTLEKLGICLNYNAYGECTTIPPSWPS